MERFSWSINTGHMDISELCVISYNSRGFGTEKQEYCRYLLSDQFVGNKLPVLCNQENFIMRGNCYKIMKALSDYHVLIKPAVKESQDKGRAKNGMLLLYLLMWKIRSLIFLLHFGGSKLLFLNVKTPSYSSSIHTFPWTKEMAMLSMLENFLKL